MHAGRYQVTDINVYLEPLIEELQELFHGIDMFDSMKNSHFLLHGILTWTIHDYPGLSLCSGEIYIGSSIIDI